MFEGVVSYAVGVTCFDVADVGALTALHILYHGACMGEGRRDRMRQ